MIRELIIAFIFMGIVVLIYFRLLIPSLAVIVAAFSDIVVTLAIVNLIGIKVNTAGIAAFLMLIGYSIDTSILLSTKMIKEKKANINDGLFEAMKTGLTMSAAGITAMFISYLLTNNFVLKQIMLILVIGLIIDLFTTWIGNVSILKYYLKKNESG